MQEPNVLTFNVETAKCPVGAHALLPNVGWCEVVASKGLERTVAYEVHALDGTVSYEEAMVDVRYLREINPKKDLVEDAGAGTVTQLRAVRAK